MRMLAFGLAFVLGLTGGLRTFAPLFAVRWPYANWSTVLSGLLLLGELIADKLPRVPSRLGLGPLVGRAVVSGYAASVLVGPMNVNGYVAAACGALGALAGAYAGYEWRVRGAPSLHVNPTLAALLEDVVSVGGAFWLVVTNV